MKQHEAKPLPRGATDWIWIVKLIACYVDVWGGEKSDRLGEESQMTSDTQQYGFATIPTYHIDSARKIRQIKLWGVYSLLRPARQNDFRPDPRFKKGAILGDDRKTFRSTPSLDRVEIYKSSLIFCRYFAPLCVYLILWGQSAGNTYIIVQYNAFRP